MRLVLGAGDVRRDDVDVVPTTARLAREEVDVLTDPAKVGIVVLRHQRNAQRPAISSRLENRQIGEGRVTTA